MTDNPTDKPPTNPANVLRDHLLANEQAWRDGDAVVATYSPCCRIIRPGKCDPGVVHNGACRAVHGGVLGPTLLLVEVSGQR